MNYLIKKVLLLAVGVLFFSSHQPPPYQFLYGRWEVYKAIDIEEVVPFIRDNPEEVAEYLASDDYKFILNTADSLASYMMGKQFTFSQDYVIVDSVKHKNPYYKLSKVEPFNYLYVRHRMVDKSCLGIPEEVNKIQVVEAYLYQDEEEKKIKDLRKVRGKFIPIPMPQYPLATFCADNLIVYKGEIIMAFSILKAGEKMYHPSWQKYLCLRRVQEK